MWNSEMETWQKPEDQLPHKIKVDEFEFRNAKLRDIHKRKRTVVEKMVVIDSTNAVAGRTYEEVHLYTVDAFLYEMDPPRDMNVKRC